MIEEVDDAIERMLKFKDGIVHMRGNFNAAIINVLWHIVASKRYDPDAEDTKEPQKIFGVVSVCRGRVCVGGVCGAGVWGVGGAVGER